jgi:hypothetical protein
MARRLLKRQRLVSAVPRWDAHGNPEVTAGKPICSVVDELPAYPVCGFACGNRRSNRARSAYVHVRAWRKEFRYVLISSYNVSASPPDHRRGCVRRHRRTPQCR